MNSGTPPGCIRPRIIIHGGAGNISPKNLPPALYNAHKEALLKIVASTVALLDKPGTTALEAACFAVSLLELNPLYNAGRGAVFTSAGRIEHEASVMVSDPHPWGPREHPAAASLSGSLAHLDLRKRACSTIHTSRVKHPILLAKEILVRGRLPNGGGAGGHNQLSGPPLEDLARLWGLDVLPPSWFWERKRWDQHRHGLGLDADTATFEREKRCADKEAGCCDLSGVVQSDSDIERQAGMLAGAAGIDLLYNGPARAVDGCAYVEEDPNGCWNGTDYLPQGTVGAVVLDRFGTVCTATSTGGMTNKLPGRIGDTPTIGAGFWAESWAEPMVTRSHHEPSSPISHLIRGDWWQFACAVLPSWLVGGAHEQGQHYLPITMQDKEGVASSPRTRPRAIGLSGTGNGDSFLRLCAGRTVAALARFAGHTPVSLSRAVSEVAGPGGALQQSAEERWNKTGEGEGGIIGIEMSDGVGTVVSDFNCGGMFRAWVDDDGAGRMMVFKKEYDAVSV